MGTQILLMILVHKLAIYAEGMIETQLFGVLNAIEEDIVISASQLGIRDFHRKYIILLVEISCLLTKCALSVGTQICCWKKFKKFVQHVGVPAVAKCV